MNALHLRYQVHDEGSWTFHVGHLDRWAVCGEGPSEVAGEAEEAEAMRGLLGQDTGDARWCRKCAAAVADRWAERGAS